MEREEGSSCGGGGGGGGNNGEWVRACDSCRSAPCLIYCRADAAYLCVACDARVHAANRVASRHDRVWVCEVCERAPAAFTCRADAATLCAACDADVHAANPLASRHHRVPVRPIPPGVLPAGGRAPPCTAAHEAEEAAASWVFVNSARADGDEYLDLVENEEIGDYLPRKKEMGDFLEKEKVEDHLVPIECLVPNEQQIQEGQQYFPMEMEYEASDAGFSFAPSYGHNVSLSSVEVSVVPDTSNMTENSSTQIRVSNGTIDLFSSPPIQIPTQFSAMDREARVMRYREKRKARKFEKTIRYASRKAYAETRPRIKGRFAKRSDIELEVDEMFATSMMSEGSYGIVPSF